MSDQISSTPPQRSATFFCRLDYIEVKGPIGPRATFAEDCFLTNEQSTIDRLLDWRFAEQIGSLEFSHFKQSPLVAYRKLRNIDIGSEQKSLFDTLLILDQFENIFWLYADSCVGHEAAFLTCGNSIFTNFYGGIRSCADGDHKTLTLRTDELYKLLELFTKHVSRDLRKKPITMHTKVNSNRLSRALDYVARAQHSVNPAEKIAFYCTAFESLFSTSQSELSHQIAERVAVLLSQDPDSRAENYWFLKKCYDTRSKFLHGSALKDTDASEVIRRVPILDDLVRRSIYCVITDESLISALDDDKSLDHLMIKRILGATSDKK
jgi:hypothetical protein